jgi:hypothetical protein
MVHVANRTQAIAAISHSIGHVPLFRLDPPVFYGDRPDPLLWFPEEEPFRKPKAVPKGQAAPGGTALELDPLEAVEFHWQEAFPGEPLIMWVNAPGLENKVEVFLTDGRNQVPARTTVTILDPKTRLALVRAEGNRYALAYAPEGLGREQDQAASSALWVKVHDFYRNPARSAEDRARVDRLEWQAFNASQPPDITPPTPSQAPAATSPEPAPACMCVIL